MTAISRLALGRHLAEAWRANPTFVEPLALSPYPDLHRKAWRAVQAEQDYYAAAHAVGVPQDAARSVLEAELDAASARAGSLEDAIRCARDRIFGGGYAGVASLSDSG